MYHPQLKIFISVADCGSFTRAADSVFLSPTAVMKQVNALEERLGMRLLERGARGVALTETGRSIYEDAKRLIAFSDEAVARARAGGAARELRVGTSLLNPCRVFLDLWLRVSGRMEGCALKIVTYEDERRGILGELEAVGTKFDFLVAACDSIAWKRRVNFLQLGTYRICCAVPRSHRLAGRAWLTVEDLHGERVMLGARGDAPSVDRVRDELERHPSIRLEDTSRFYDVEVFNACERLGGVLLTLECWSEIHPSLVTIPVRWDFSVPYGLLYPLEPGPLARVFLRALEETGAAGEYRDRHMAVRG